MHLSKLTVEGFKGFGSPFEVEFAQGLYVLVGENGVGKSAVIDAIRAVLQEGEGVRVPLGDSDFHRPFGFSAQPASSSIRISAEFNNLSDEEAVAFLTWSVFDGIAKLSLVVEETGKERKKRTIWGGESSASLFDWELLETITCVYLPPLRDAEAKLRDGRGSRLARLLRTLNKNPKKQNTGDGGLHPLEQKVKEFNQSLADDKDECIAKANALIRQRLIEVIGTVFGQDTRIQFSETSFSRIVENLRLLFYPEISDGLPTDAFRSLDENSLGYNNLMYLATVLAELTVDGQDDPEYLKILLIEEPEAHLHPQLQIRLLKFLQARAKDAGLQVIVTTHSPVLSSAVSVESVVHLSCTKKDQPIAIPLRECGLATSSRSFIDRWMDATKSTLLFAKGVILVEGIAEALLVPEMAKRVLREYHIKHVDQPILESLEDAGVSVINMNGIYFRHFMQIFCDLLQTGAASLPIRCAGITDNDPPTETKPTRSSSVTGTNPALKLLTVVGKSDYCRLFVCPLKTFEYDLAMEGANLNLMVSILAKVWPSDKGSVYQELTVLASTQWETVTDELAKADAAYIVLRRIEDDCVGKGFYAQSLAARLEKDRSIPFAIPDYIAKAVLWSVGRNA